MYLSFPLPSFDLANAHLAVSQYEYYSTSSCTYA